MSTSWCHCLSCLDSQARLCCISANVNTVKKAKTPQCYNENSFDNVDTLKELTGLSFEMLSALDDSVVPA
jgi:hypothetical protein